MLRRRDRLGDRRDDHAEQLQRDQHPGDRVQPVGVGGDERVAGANRPDHRQQPLEDQVIERDADRRRAPRCARMAHHVLRVGHARDAQRLHRPWLVEEGVGEQPEDAGAETAS